MINIMAADDLVDLDDKELGISNHYTDLFFQG